MPPTYGNGKICYIEMPATDIARSSEFYGKVFGWNIRRRGDGSISFDDGVGQVSGTWTQKRIPTPPGLMVYIMVDDASAMMDLIVANGGEIVQAIGADAPDEEVVEPCVEGAVEAEPAEPSGIVERRGGRRTRARVGRRKPIRAVALVSGRSRCGRCDVVPVGREWGVE